MATVRSHSCAAWQCIADALIGAASMVAAWWLSTHGVIPISKEIPDLAAYLGATPAVVAVLVGFALFFRLYRTRRAGSYGSLLIDVLKVNLQAGLVILALSFYYRGFSYSRVIITAFLAMNTFGMFLHHFSWMAWERRRRMRGIGTRNCLIVGIGGLAQELESRLNAHAWTGLKVQGFIDPGTSRDGSDPLRVSPDRVLGTVEDLERLVDQRGVREILVAVPFRALGVLPDLDETLSRSNIGLRWIPDLQALHTVSSEVSDLEGLPMINLRGVRTHGYNGILKRGLDIFVSASMLFALSPLMAFIAMRIRSTCGSPVLYTQERMGLDGRVFQLLKFRSMGNDAETGSGPVWATEDDPRVTPFGNWLRRTSLDELPQLWNILKGEMSLVGPRPERPVFIDKFRHTVPSYMLRHRMKAGLTGWAQIHGWRGNTCLEKRVQCDLYYARHWSIWLDLKILFLTPMRGWGKQRNAY